MRVFDFISVKLTLCLITGILLGFYFDFSPTAYLIPLVVLFFATGWLFKKQKRNAFPLFGIVAAATTICLGMFTVSLSNPIHSNDHYSISTKKEKLWHVKVTEILKPTSFSNRYISKVKHVDSDRASGKLLLSFPLDSLFELNVDDELFFYGNPKMVNPPLNPYQFDYQGYLQKKGIHHQIQLQPNGIVKSKKASKTLFGLASNFREFLIHRLNQYEFGEEELGVIQALLLGKRDDISDATYNDYKNAGAVHILAVSGLHVGIILLLLQFLLRPLERLPKGKQLKIIVVILLLWVFAFVAGLSPSIIRAVTMFSFLAYGMNLNRPVNQFNIIALSIFFILLINPMFLFEVGFQMSYAAVIAIVWIYPKLQRFWYPESWLVRKTWQLLSVSVAAQLGVLPLSLFYFHQFPALFFISNLVIIPFLGIILGLGILVLLLASLKGLPNFLIVAYNFLIQTMNSVVGWVAKQEGFVFRDIPFDALQLVLGYALIFGLILTLSKPKFKNLALLFMSIIGLTGYGIYNQWKLNNTEQLVLAHQTRNSILLHQKDSQLNVLAQDFESAKQIVTNFKVAERILSANFDSLQNSYKFGDQSIYLMDSLGVYPVKRQLDYLILTQSPKVNLERLLDSLQPKIILADGSNYKSYIDCWKKTALKRKLPFHYTGEKGAYVFDVISKESR